MKTAATMWSCFALFGVIGTAQTNSTPAKPTITARSGQMGGVTYFGPNSFFFGVGTVMQQAIVHPYSAEQITERVQTLADGTHISQTVSKVHLYRDSQGRTRMEHSFILPPGAQGSAPIFVTIADPVAGCQYMFDTRQHTARRITLPPQAPRNSQWFQKAVPPAAASFPRAANIIPANSVPRATTGAETQRESLGTHSIEGIPAEGTRVTTTYPAGSVGNDRDFTTTSETWISKDLGLAVLSKSSDPRYGETTTRLTDISQTEPDPNLFLVPPDYTIVDQSNR
ncbi:MAG TPA: hypothetical protein VN633_05250 [Bryobacteraceae bacterium]|nr:hypothetical protein [Bryobacteraceae bacterium]